MSAWLARGLWAVFTNLGDLGARVCLREEEAVCSEGVGSCSIARGFRGRVSVAAAQVVSRAKVSPDVSPHHLVNKPFREFFEKNIYICICVAWGSHHLNLPPWFSVISFFLKISLEKCF